ncbi:MAG: HAD family hydrolase [Oscillospiraceae bacterium]|nr:HAD family hydrolase [Oscillospiraceae bacterium]
MSFSIETIRPYTGSGFKCALFDFDGTISLIREGWQKVMIPYFCEVIEALGTDENTDEVKAEVTEFVDRLTGKQTIYQCIALDEAVVKRGGAHVEPGEYKAEYLRRLNLKIADRKNGLADGRINPDSLSVRGAKAFIEALRAAGIKCFLASGTDESDVIYEASLLGVKDLFDGGIHGARDALLDCSKEAVIKNMIERQKLIPEELVTFGDGFVEIELTATLGGYAVGVATDEKTGDGVDAAKRTRLINAGADMIIPHFEKYGDVIKALTVG